MAHESDAPLKIISGLGGGGGADGGLGGDDGGGGDGESTCPSTVKALAAPPCSAAQKRVHCAAPVSDPMHA